MSSKNHGPSDYKVGKNRPPLEPRWPKGTSGNPGGRKKGSRNRKTIVRGFQRKRYTVVIGGRSRKLSVDDIGLHHLHQAIIKGDLKAYQVWLEIVDRYGDSEQVTATLGELKREDLQILANFAARISKSDGGA